MFSKSGSQKWEATLNNAYGKPDIHFIANACKFIQKIQGATNEMVFNYLTILFIHFSTCFFGFYNYTPLFFDFAKKWLGKQTNFDSFTRCIPADIKISDEDIKKNILKAKSMNLGSDITSSEELESEIETTPREEENQFSTSLQECFTMEDHLEFCDHKENQDPNDENQNGNEESGERNEESGERNEESKDNNDEIRNDSGEREDESEEIEDESKESEEEEEENDDVNNETMKLILHIQRNMRDICDQEVTEENCKEIMQEIVKTFKQGRKLEKIFGDK